MRAVVYPAEAYALRHVASHLCGVGYDVTRVAAGDQALLQVRARAPLQERRGGGIGCTWLLT